ncbi:DsbA family oxidoreductase [Clostridium sp. 19966]|uniref:DsbA family oxidoreductase n=1 Tax=Clostridium sp. 19966 TaxID=2768166 RepID=UPI0028E02557|nr:DsbA family oxidoreductase [Clostridium sp. 19966]MDT8716891.1 DsbA family oxidoreductase [Clostridium sp. 19966]
MKIEVWSDFVCPFCYIGKRRLENALDKFEHKDEVEVVFKSFELDPEAKKKYDESIHEIIAKKYGISVAEAKASNDQLVAQAKALGLDYNFEDIKPTNTFDAHRLYHYAKAQGKLKEFSERTLKAYFVDSLNISDYNVLADLASEVGLDREKALKVLEDNEYSEDVRKDEQKAAQLKISGVPFFVFNDKYAVSGAQPSDLFLEVLDKVKKEELSSPMIEFLSRQQENDEASEAGSCADGKCSI